MHTGGPPSSGDWAGAGSPYRVPFPEVSEEAPGFGASSLTSPPFDPSRLISSCYARGPFGPPSSSGAIVTYVPPLRPNCELRFPYLLSFGRPRLFRLGQFPWSLRFGFVRTAPGLDSLGVGNCAVVGSWFSVVF